MSHHTGSVPDTPRRPDWRDQAACAGADNDDWFPPPTNRVAVHTAKSVCFRCPVLTQCAQFALDERLTDGVWGGLSEGQRSTIWKKHRAHEIDDLTTVRRIVYGVLYEEMNPTASLRDLWDRHTKPLPGGHIGWTRHVQQVAFRDVVYTPRQLAFIVDRGHKASGAVKRLPECPVVECIHPRHLADSEERFLRKQAERRAAEQAAAEALAQEALAS